MTWQLYSADGEPMPHSDCPMAEAIRERRQIRDKIAIALRPDGSRRAFRAYPAPWFDGEGNLLGAVNLLIDVTEEQAGALTDQAARCRRLARATTDSSAAEILSTMASGYAQTAATLTSRE